MRELKFATAALAFAVVAASGLAQAAPSSAPTRAVGVCVRWSGDANHPAEAVVVQPSDDPAFDAALPAVLETSKLEQPTNYDGGWVGLSIGFEGSQPKAPDCSELGAAPLPAGDRL